MRQCRLNFAEHRYDCEAGIVGEHNATELIITPPAIMPDEAVYRLCFEPGGVSEIISKRSDGTLAYPLPAAVTATAFCCVTLIGYIGNEQVYKSRMVQLHFCRAADGDADIDPQQPGIIAEVNRNTAARHTHENKPVLDKFAETDGKPTYGGQALGGGASDFIIKMTVEANGDNYTVMSCDKTVEQIDAAFNADKNIVLTVAPEDGLYYALPLVYATPGLSYLFESFYDAYLFFASIDKRDGVTFDMIQMPASAIAYSNDAIPTVDNVGDTLDELVPKSHSHENKDTLDKLSASNGKLQYDGSDVGLKGDKGDTGATGAPGLKGDTGAPGKDGKDGTNGITPTIGANGNWYLGTTDTGKPSRGEKGDPGAPGKDGADGKQGAAGTDGITPHIGENGNWYIGNTDTGKPSRGVAGAKGSDGANGKDGAQGEKGADGKTPVKGTDYWTAADKQEIIDDIHPVYYIDLAGNYPNYTCPVAMDDIKAAYNSGYNLVCRCAMGVYTATLPLFIPVPAANTWIFSGSGALKSMNFSAQSFTVAITSNGVAADQTLLNQPLNITAGDTTYSYDGRYFVDIAVKPATQLITTAEENITLADNTEYRLTDVTTLNLSYPEGDFESWMRLTFATSGTITVTLPADTKYIGTAPDFKNGETWELSFKDKVLAAQKVGEGT